MFFYLPSPSSTDWVVLYPSRNLGKAKYGSILCSDALRRTLITGHVHYTKIIHASLFLFHWKSDSLRPRAICYLFLHPQRQTCHLEHNRNSINAEPLNYEPPGKAFEGGGSMVPLEKQEMQIRCTRSEYLIIFWTCLTSDTC